MSRSRATRRLVCLVGTVPLAPCPKRTDNQGRTITCPELGWDSSDLEEVPPRGGMVGEVHTNFQTTVLCAHRLVQRLTGPARLLAMSWPSVSFDHANGAKEYLRRLAASPLVWQSLPNTAAIYASSTLPFVAMPARRCRASW